MHKVRIVDHKAVQSVLQEVLKRHGSQERAATALGLTRDTFRNWLVGKVTDAMLYETFASILGGLGGYPREFGRGPRLTEFAPKADDPADQPALDAEAATKCDLHQRFLRSVLTEDEEFAWSNYVGWAQRELKRVRTRAEPIFEALWKLKQPRRRFSDFLERVGRLRDALPHPDDLRCWLALYRVVEPLADSGETWGMERTWAEMDDAGDLKAYLKAALRREELLLKPTGDLDRVSRARPPMGYQEAMELSAAADHFFEENPSATIEDWHAQVEAYESADREGFGDD